MAIFNSCEVRDGPRGKHVAVTRLVAAGEALIIEEDALFALEADHALYRCALCGCPCEATTSGVACQACLDRAEADMTTKRWENAIAALGSASARARVLP